ncbi:NARE ribosyltransferase, partial [Pomatorhinus ruficollis]|nr:NARE ribosyltransferase [Pomatorhinus ruficollis]
MASLAHTLALLAMTMAVTAIKVVPLDMAWDSFDDRYQGCRPAMTAALPALNRSEFQKNPLFARVWVKAAVALQRRRPRLSPLSSVQATAIMAYTMDDLHSVFNDAMHEAGRSLQEYRHTFHYKTLHFLLTDALATLRESFTRAMQCNDVFQQVCGVQFRAQRGQSVRFGEFRSMSLSKPTGQCSGKETLFQVLTCHSEYIGTFSEDPGTRGVLIPPFETFKVTEVTQKGNKAVIKLSSAGTYNKYNCEWLKYDTTEGQPGGGSVSIAPFHLGGLLLVTTALAVATGIL